MILKYDGMLGGPTQGLADWGAARAAAQCALCRAVRARKGGNPNWAGLLLPMVAQGCSDETSAPASPAPYCDSMHDRACRAVLSGAAAMRAAQTGGLLRSPRKSPRSAHTSWRSPHLLRPPSSSPCTFLKLSRAKAAFRCHPSPPSTACGCRYAADQAAAAADSNSAPPAAAARSHATACKSTAALRPCSFAPPAPLPRPSPPRTQGTVHTKLSGALKLEDGTGTVDVIAPVAAAAASASGGGDPPGLELSSVQLGDYVLVVGKLLRRAQGGRQTLHIKAHKVRPGGAVHVVGAASSERFTLYASAVDGEHSMCSCLIQRLLVHLASLLVNTSCCLSSPLAAAQPVPRMPGGGERGGRGRGARGGDAPHAAVEPGGGKGAGGWLGGPSFQHRPGFHLRVVVQCYVYSSETACTDICADP